MARKSGFSHALAALISLVLGRILVTYLKPYFPLVIDPLEKWGASVEEWLEGRLGVEFHPGLLIPVIVATLLAFAWGVLYHFIRHRDRER